MNGGRGVAFGLFTLTVLGSGCLDPSIAGPGPDDDVRVVYVGPAIVDSVGAEVQGVRFFVSLAGSEDAPVDDVTAFFEARGEGCGVAADPSDRTDAGGLAETTWRLGDVAGECALRVRVLNSRGILLASADITGEVLHGQATSLLWIAEGEAVSAPGVFQVGGADAAAFDRLANEVPWRFRVVSGPVQRLGVDFGSEGGRTLVPTGVAGSGRVAVESRWGDVVELDLCVTAGTPTSTLRLFWTRPGEAAPVCPT